MQGFIVVACVIGGATALIVLALRQARRVRDATYRSKAPPRAEQPWQEALTSEDGLTLTRDGSHNEELLAMGAEARQHKWTITHQG